MVHCFIIWSIHTKTDLWIKQIFDRNNFRIYFSAGRFRFDWWILEERFAGNENQNRRSFHLNKRLNIKIHLKQATCQDCKTFNPIQTTEGGERTLIFMIFMSQQFSSRLVQQHFQLYALMMIIIIIGGPLTKCQHQHCFKCEC